MSLPNESYSPQFAMTTAGFVIPIITGTLSTLCSMIILNIIRLSPQKLTTTYHRIMALMSIFDIMSSVCMALTTLPMPSDDTLRFAGPMLGNKTTCQMQGFILLMGLLGGGTLYMCLAWYFVCRMTFKMSSEKIRKRLEPVFYIYSFLLTLTLPSINLHNDMINTVPNEQFCLIAPAHSNCTYSTDGRLQSCEFVSMDAFTYEVYQILLAFNLFMIVMAMLIIIWSISKNNRNIKRAHDSETSDLMELQEENEEMNLSKLRYSRVVVIQALMYIITYFLTWIFPFLSNILGFERDVPDIIMIGKAILFPMQGFWNLLIFLYDKAYLVLQNDATHTSLWEAIKIILLDPDSASGIILPASFTNNGSRSNQDSRSHQDGGMQSLESESFRHDVVADQVFSVNIIRRRAELHTQQAHSSRDERNVASVNSPVGFISGSMSSRSNVT